MAKEFFIPKLGQTVDEVILVKWLIEDGAKVSHGQEVMEVETDKAVFPVESNAEGYIHIGPYHEGDVLPVLTVVAVIGKPEDKFSVKVAALPESKQVELASKGAVSELAVSAVAGDLDPEHKAFASPRAKKLAGEKGVDLNQVNPSGQGGIRVVERDVVAFLDQTPRATPLAQKIAAVEGVDLRDIAGTGPHGKILKDDVARVMMPKGAAEYASSAKAMPSAEVIERIPLKGVRAIIADRMATSVHTTARVTLVTEVNAAEFVAARNRIKKQVEGPWGFAPGYNDLLAKIVAVALRQCPYMNARLAPDAIEHLGHINIGMAVDTERGLLVPVIHDADRKDLRQFGTEFRALADRARNGRSMPDDLSGGTFTITSLGTYNIDAFTPVINLPEAAILGVGRIAPKPTALGDAVVIRPMWTLSLVFDHRLTDGAPAAKFLQTIAQMIEEPYLLLTTS